MQDPCKHENQAHRPGSAQEQGPRASREVRDDLTWPILPLDIS